MSHVLPDVHLFAEKHRRFRRLLFQNPLPSKIKKVKIFFVTLIVVASTFSAAPAFSATQDTDTTLESGTIKGAVVTSFGTPNGNPSYAVPGTVRLTAVRSISSVGATFVAAGGSATAEVFLHDGSSGAPGAPFTSQQLVDQQLLVVKVTSADQQNWMYYLIRVEVDSQPPVFSWDFYNFAYVSKNTVAIPVLSELTALDNIDGDVTANISIYRVENDNKTCEASVKGFRDCLAGSDVGGQVIVTLSVQDQAGNETAQRLYFRVVNDPVINQISVPILVGEIDPEIVFAHSPAAAFDLSINVSQTLTETINGTFDNQHLRITGIPSGLVVSGYRSTEDGNFHIFFAGSASSATYFAIIAKNTVFADYKSTAFAELDSDPIGVGVLLPQNYSITGIDAPVTGGTPDTTAVSGTGHTPIVEWWVSENEPLVGTFQAGVVYTAKITLNALPRITSVRMPNDFFTVTGATSLFLDPNYLDPSTSSAIFAVYPATKTDEEPPIDTEVPRIITSDWVNSVDLVSSAELNELADYIFDPRVELATVTDDFDEDRSLTFFDVMTVTARGSNCKTELSENNANLKAILKNCLARAPSSVILTFRATDKSGKHSVERPTLTIRRVYIPPKKVTTPNPMKVKAKKSAKALANELGIKIPKNSKLSIKVSKSSMKFCKVSKGYLIAVKKGNCVFTLTVQPPKPKKGKKPPVVSKTTSLRII